MTARMTRVLHPYLYLSHLLYSASGNKVRTLVHKVPPGLAKHNWFMDCCDVARLVLAGLEIERSEMDVY